MTDISRSGGWRSGRAGGPYEVRPFLSLTPHHVAAVAVVSGKPKHLLRAVRARQRIHKDITFFAILLEIEQHFFCVVTVITMCMVC